MAGSDIKTNPTLPGVNADQSNKPAADPSPVTESPKETAFLWGPSYIPVPSTVHSNVAIDVTEAMSQLKGIDGKSNLVVGNDVPEKIHAQTLFNIGRKWPDQVHADKDLANLVHEVAKREGLKVTDQEGYLSTKTIKELQTKLGCSNDGVIGTDTRDAIEQAAEKHGLIRKR